MKEQWPLPRDCGDDNAHRMTAKAVVAIENGSQFLPKNARFTLFTAQSNLLMMGPNFMPGKTPECGSQMVSAMLAAPDPVIGSLPRCAEDAKVKTQYTDAATDVSQQ